MVGFLVSADRIGVDGLSLSVYPICALIGRFDDDDNSTSMTIIALRIYSLFIYAIIPLDKQTYSQYTHIYHYVI